MLRSKIYLKFRLMWTVKSRVQVRNLIIFFNHLYDFVRIFFITSNNTFKSLEACSRHNVITLAQKGKFETLKNDVTVEKFVHEIM